MTPVSSIAASGLQAQTARLEASAINVARLTTTAPPDQPEQVPVLTTQQTSLPGGGTRADIAARPNTAILIPDPGNPLAGPDGRVATPGVALSQEVSTQIQARAAYSANLDVIRVNDQMMDALLKAV